MIVNSNVNKLGRILKEETRELLGTSLESLSNCSEQHGRKKIRILKCNVLVVTGHKLRLVLGGQILEGQEKDIWMERSLQHGVNDSRMKSCQYLLLSFMFR